MSRLTTKVVSSDGLNTTIQHPKQMTLETMVSASIQGGYRTVASDATYWQGCKETEQHETILVTHYHLIDRKS